MLARHALAHIRSLGACPGGFNLHVPGALSLIYSSVDPLGACSSLHATSRQHGSFKTAASSQPTQRSWLSEFASKWTLQHGFQQQQQQQQQQQHQPHQQVVAQHHYGSCVCQLHQAEPRRYMGSYHTNRNTGVQGHDH